MGRKFDKLSKKIEHEYEKKGVSHEHAKYIGKATAAKIARLKKKGPQK
jgi:hypothetical protein